LRSQGGIPAEYQAPHASPKHPQHQCTGAQPLGRRRRRPAQPRLQRAADLGRNLGGEHLHHRAAAELRQRPPQRVADVEPQRARLLAVRQHGKVGGRTEQGPARWVASLVLDRSSAGLHVVTHPRLPGERPLDRPERHQQLADDPVALGRGDCRAGHAACDERRVLHGGPDLVRGQAERQRLHDSVGVWPVRVRLGLGLGRQRRGHRSCGARHAEPPPRHRQKRTRLRPLPRVQHPPDRPHDAVVAGAAAQVARQLKPHLAVVGAGQPQHDVARRHQHARRAVAALQRVLGRERQAQRCRHLVVLQPFDAAHLAPGAVGGVGDAGTRWLPVQQDRARAANPVLAAQVRAGEQQALAQEVGQMGAWLGLRLQVCAVHPQLERRHACAPPAMSMARRRITTCI